MSWDVESFAREAARIDRDMHDVPAAVFCVLLWEKGVTVLPVDLNSDDRMLSVGFSALTARPYSIVTGIGLVMRSQITEIHPSVRTDVSDGLCGYLRTVDGTEAWMIIRPEEHPQMLPLMMMGAPPIERLLLFLEQNIPSNN